MSYGSEGLSKISCDEVLNEIELYVDGELDRRRSLELDEHLRECRSCLGHADFQRRLKDVVRSKWGPETPEHLMDRISQAIRGSEEPAGR